MIEIPGYKIHREIDSSDYCHSYSAIQLSTGKTMVVSVFSHSATQYSLIKKIFNNIENKLAHKVFGVITPIKEFKKTQGHTYIISDLLSNSCQQVYKERNTNIQTIFENIYKIAVSLNLYHQVGFYHGGVSLDNLFHDNNRLTLGLAAFNQNFSNIDTDINLSKESYKAPEREVSESKSRDFYALGVVLYELIFKQKPFVATTKEQLDQLKQTADITIPNKDYEHLKHIFSALLNPNPNDRVSTASEFKQLASMSEIYFDEVTFNIENITVIDQAIDTEKMDNSPKKPKPSYIYYLAYAIVIALVIFSMLNSTNDTTNDNAISDQNIIENTSSTPAQNTSKEVVVKPNDFNDFMASAKQSFKKNQIALALMSINQAIKINPTDEDAIKIKRQLENELKIKAIIQQAEQYVQQGKITLPAKNNAIATYKKLQSMLPKGDLRAKNGINKISKTYHRLALKQYNLKNIALAKSILIEGLRATPKSTPLNRLNALIIKEENIQRQTLEDERINQQVLADADQEKQRIASVRLQQQEIEAQKQKQFEINFQIQKEQQRQQQILKFHNDAQLSLNASPLSLNSIAVAIDHLQSLEFLSANAAKNFQLRNDIDNAFLSLSEQQFAANQYKQAQTTIRTGLKTNAKNYRLSKLLDKITDIQQQEKIKAVTTTEPKSTPPIKEEKTLPIFGTF